VHLGARDLEQSGVRIPKQIEQGVIDCRIPGRTMIAGVLVQVTLDQHHHLPTA